ncbi:hypothetical protein C9374_008164 [Naegleria lovaniensis]|uniref:B30.2/SPRY domain-containing protein n=1 Tax=Naegleria lovaniensis TaxID=51637 RepID=A0AA88GK17_NAELO|nr:uncharacterized protein C9374_008164 [Naegleria lovaniensis]KAG2378525.1 hypothetical protein C9374_008164 [Naegleria lovaniensis]
MSETLPSTITLNVGGQLFTTSRFTLSQQVGKNELEHVLASIVNGKHAIEKDRDGNIFIDRDGTYFHYILNYLRNGGNLSQTILPSVRYQPLIARSLQLEAGYYGLTELVDYFTVQRWLLKRRFQLANCHPNVVVLDGGKTLICKESSGKNWYSVSSKYPIINMDYSTHVSSHETGLDTYDEEAKEFDGDEGFADVEEVNGFPSSNNYYLNMAGVTSVDGNVTDVSNYQNHASSQSRQNPQVDEIQITASKLSIYFGNMKLLKFHVKNYYEIVIENTKNFNIVLGISKQKTSYFHDSWTVGFIANSYGFNVWSMKKYTKKTQIEYGERCERGDRVGMYVNTALGYIEYFRNGRSMGIAFDGLTKELSEGNWYVVVSLYNQGDCVTLNTNAVAPLSVREEEYLNSNNNKMEELK